MNAKRILYILTRTPLHVGAGTSVGAIDQPIIRERHTGFPVISASSLKGTFADAWTGDLHEQDGKQCLRVTTRKENNKEVLDKVSDAAWLFGSDHASHSFAGALQFSEARLLAFPIRSAKGSFAWITCPLILRRAYRDGAITFDPSPLPDLSDEQAIFSTTGPLALGDKIVLEEYTFTRHGDPPNGLGDALKQLLPTDPVWQEVATRLAILSDGMMSFFAQNACEIAQHVRIDDETGTADSGGLFNQENVPSETMFYAVLHAFSGRGEKFKTHTPDQALSAFQAKLNANGAVFQFGGDASTGLGYCTVRLSNGKEA